MTVEPSVANRAVPAEGTRRRAAPVSSPAASAGAMRALARAASVDDLRLLARRRLPRAVFDFYDGGAETEATLRGNARAFDAHAFLPRYLVDVSRIDTGTTIAGVATALPMVIAPTGAIGFGWPIGDVAIARAARDAGKREYRTSNGDNA